MIYLYTIYLTILNYFILVIFIISILADSNRVPYDLPEAESELVAGFITEYSSIYFSIILLTEYASIIALTYLIIILFSSNPLSLLIYLLLVCLIRSTLNRLKFDELMSNAWITVLPLIFGLLIFALFMVN